MMLQADVERPLVATTKHTSLSSDMLFNVAECEDIPMFIREDFNQWYMHYHFSMKASKGKYSKGANCWGVSLSIFLNREIKAAGSDDRYRVFSPNTADMILQDKGISVPLKDLKPGDIIRFGEYGVGNTRHYCTFLRQYGRDNAIVLTKNGVGGQYHIWPLDNFAKLHSYGDICGITADTTGYYTRRKNATAT